MNVGAALREFLLEGFLVAGELGGGGVGDCLVGVSAVAAGDCLVRVSSGVGGCAGCAATRGCCGACLVKVAGDVGTAVGSGYGGDRADGDSAGAGGRLVGVSAITADVDAVVALAAVPVSASTLVAVRAPVAVVALGVAASVAAVVPAGGFAVPVLSWVCKSGVASQGWVGELVEGWSGCGVDGALWGAGRGVWGVVSWVDEDFSEEDGVEEFLEAGWGVWVGVEVVAVFEEGEGFFEVLFDAFAVGGEGGEFSGDVVEFAGEAGLFGFEEVEGDGVGVVGFEEFGLLGFEFAGLGGECLGVGVLAGVDVVEFEAEVFLDGAPVFGGDVDVVVEVGDASVDFVDEDGFEGAFGAVALAVGADEVWVDLAVSGFGVVDDEPAAALAAADGGFEVVVVDALAFAVAVLVEDGLDALPGGVVDEGLVFAGVLDALVGDDAAVVGVAEDGEEFVVAEGMGRPAGCGDGGQALSGEVVSEGG